MVASKHANRPRWSGTGFEIWFFVVLIPGQARALWIRLTRFADAGQRDARIWAVLSEGEEVVVAREVLPLAALTSDGDELHVRIAQAGNRSEAELGHGFARGRCGRIAWDFRYVADDPLIERLPKLPGFLPLGTHSTHPHAEAHVDGWMELDGQRIVLDGGMFTQMHLWGTQRVEWLRWLWAPRFEGYGEDTELELTAVAPKASGPALCALWARIGRAPDHGPDHGTDLGLGFDHSGLLDSVRARIDSPRPGVLHHVSTRAGQRLVVRAWAPAESFAGWDYRKTGGGDLHVAQTNLAQVEIEVYRRVGLGWQPQRRLRSTCAALEFHGPEPHPEFDYVGWDADAHAHTRMPGADLPTGVATPACPGAGEWIPTPAPTRIVALGLTYRAHAEETGQAADAVVFEQDPQAWTPGEGTIRRPSDAAMLAALARLDPRLLGELAEFGFMPALLDYEVELGLVLLDGLADPSAPGRVALVVANDLSARTLQILGEGARNRLDYWAAAKSFPGFAPTTARAWVPARFELDAWPALTLTTRVNGRIRQQASTDALLERPREMLARVLDALGPLAPGTLLLTGTPAGIALQVPAWKRTLGAWLLDRPGRLRAALAKHSSKTAFLRPGDLVEVSGGWLGGFAQIVG
jgi:2-keto-4-pentenoate hydratase/2-oxohepta-3-ene-1,7-dioic acid hydratase in catechol pathway